jgi:MarR-like DNA-binding transcriptional regulator SgrR of sgrS sRNA
MFVLKHQDGDIEYKFEKGGVAIENSKLYLSIELKAQDGESFPDCYFFAIDGYPLNQGLKSSKIKISTHPNDEQPNVYVYTTFHACEVEAEASISVLSSNEISISLSVISDDVIYYNEKAKPNLWIGSVNLTQKSKNELWIPA